jgi:ubiquinol-cytochrome c reductase cytochrome c subunit
MPLNNPSDSPLRHRPFFNKQQIAQLVAYVNALPAINGVNRSGPGIPNIQPLCPTATPQPGCVTLSQGQSAYALDCASCHQAAAAGNMLSKGNLIPSLHNSSALQVAEAVRVGPKPMPVFGTNQLSEAQVSAIAHYVEFLHKRGNPGGLPISHFGPVAEGFVGILIGLGALLIATRLMGTRS